MLEAIQAIYENGVLRPLVPLDLAENEVVTIDVFRGDEYLFDLDIGNAYAAGADDSISLEDVRKALSSIKGSLDQAIDEDRGEY
jgi:predicted DNA-binding antitoxin AbrB/MazE fold protein